jgi:hypothetical protein
MHPVASDGRLSRVGQSDKPLATVMSVGKKKAAPEKVAAQGAGDTLIGL